MKVILIIFFTSLVVLLLVFFLNAATYNGSKISSKIIPPDKKYDKKSEKN